MFSLGDFVSGAGKKQKRSSLCHPCRAMAAETKRQTARTSSGAASWYARLPSQSLALNTIREEMITEMRGAAFIFRINLNGNDCNSMRFQFFE